VTDTANTPEPNNSDPFHNDLYVDPSLYAGPQNSDGIARGRRRYVR